MRPKHLAEIATLAAEGESFDRCLASFLDGFYKEPTAVALKDPPPALSALAGDNGRVQDAYFAATSVYLAWRFSLPCPDENVTLGCNSSRSSARIEDWDAVYRLNNSPTSTLTSGNAAGPACSPARSTVLEV